MKEAIYRAFLSTTFQLNCQYPQKQKEGKYRVILDVYTRANCPHCVETKLFLKSRDVDYNEYEIGMDIPREKVVSMFPEQKALPIIVIDGDVVGRSELRTIVENGQLSLFD